MNETRSAPWSSHRRSSPRSLITSRCGAKQRSAQCIQKQRLAPGVLSALDCGNAHADHHAQEIAEGAESWRGLVALGISGGLVPCPSALILLLTAVSLGRTALGLVLVTAFSFGLAILVTAVGTAVVLFGDRIRSMSMGGRIALALPVFSAVVVTVLGIGLTWDGLIEVVGGA